MRLGVSPAEEIAGRRARSAGSRLRRAVREKRRCPPGVVKARSLPASLHRRTVAGDTPRRRLASERLTQSGRGVPRTIRKPAQIYQKVANSLILARIERTRCFAQSLVGSRPG